MSIFTQTERGYLEGKTAQNPHLAALRKAQGAERKALRKRALNWAKMVGNTSDRADAIRAVKQLEAYVPIGQHHLQHAIGKLISAISDAQSARSSMYGDRGITRLRALKHLNQGLPHLEAAHKFLLADLKNDS